MLLFFLSLGSFSLGLSGSFGLFGLSGSLGFRLGLGGDAVVHYTYGIGVDGILGDQYHIGRTHRGGDFAFDLLGDLNGGSLAVFIGHGLLDQFGKRPGAGIAFLGGGGVREYAVTLLIGSLASQRILQVFLADAGVSKLVGIGGIVIHTLQRIVGSQVREVLFSVFGIISDAIGTGA